MQVEAALVREQGVDFVVVPVRNGILESSTRRDAVTRDLQRAWPKAHVVLLHQGSDGRPRYYGRIDIVRFLTSVTPSRLPWKTWSL